MPGPRKLGDAIGEWLKASGITRRDENREVAEAWSRAVGPEMARRTRVAGFRRGVLAVTVESAALHHEIEAFLQDELLRKMRKELPGRKIALLKCAVREPGR